MRGMIIWAVWVFLVLASFFAIEIPAVRNKIPGDTLSENLRLWLGIRPHRKWGIAGTFIFGGFFVWFLFHIITNAV